MQATELAGDVAALKRELQAQQAAAAAAAARLSQEHQQQLQHLQQRLQAAAAKAAQQAEAAESSVQLRCRLQDAEGCLAVMRAERDALQVCGLLWCAAWLGVGMGASEGCR